MRFRFERMRRDQSGNLVRGNNRPQRFRPKSLTQRNQTNRRIISLFQLKSLRNAASASSPGSVDRRISKFIQLQISATIIWESQSGLLAGISFFHLCESFQCCHEQRQFVQKKLLNCLNGFNWKWDRKANWICEGILRHVRLLPDQRTTMESQVAIRRIGNRHAGNR